MSCISSFNSANSVSGDSSVVLTDFIEPYILEKIKLYLAEITNKEIKPETELEKSITRVSEILDCHGGVYVLYTTNDNSIHRAAISMSSGSNYSRPIIIHRGFPQGAGKITLVNATASKINQAMSVIVNETKSITDLWFLTVKKECMDVTERMNFTFDPYVLKQISPSVAGPYALAVNRKNAEQIMTRKLRDHVINLKNENKNFNKLKNNVVNDLLKRVLPGDAKKVEAITKSLKNLEHDEKAWALMAYRAIHPDATSIFSDTQNTGQGKMDKAKHQQLLEATNWVHYEIIRNFSLAKL